MRGDSDGNLLAFSLFRRPRHLNMTSPDYDVQDLYDYEDLNYGTPTIINTLSRTQFGSRSSTPIDSSQPRSNKEQPLPFLLSSDDDVGVQFDRQNPTHIRYTVEWKLSLMKKRLSTLTHVTEKDIALPPKSFWEQKLKPRLESEAELKLPGPSFKLDETKIAVSVTKRAQNSFLDCSPGYYLKWDAIEEQLRSWSHLLRQGKELRIILSVIYKESGEGTVTPRGRAKRGSAAQRAEREERAGVWRDVYRTMRCPGPPCSLGPHCWIDLDDGNKHYKIWKEEMILLIDYVYSGNLLESHRDVPEHIRGHIMNRPRDQRVPEEQENGRRKRKRNSPCSAECSAADACSCIHGAAKCGSNHTSGSRIPGPRETAVENYYQWQCQQVVTEDWKEGLRQARQITLEEGLELARLRAAPEIEAEVFVSKGVKRGIALQFTSNVQAWLDEQ